VLRKKLGIAPEPIGRAAITEQPGGVWDFFALLGHPKGKIFTNYPHLTFSIGPRSAVATITVPNAVRRDIFAALQNAPARDFDNAIVAFLAILGTHYNATDHVRPMMILVQRRFETQRSAAFHDAILNFDLRTTVRSRKNTKHRHQPKFQPEWLKMAQEVIQGKHSNLQFQIGCEFDYEKCSATHKPDAEMLFVNAWYAAREFLQRVGVKI
jgi:hypothetical protein